MKETGTTGSSSGGGIVARPGTSGDEDDERTGKSAVAFGSVEAAKRGQVGRRSTVDRDEQETEKEEESVPERERKAQGVKNMPRPLEQGRAKNKSSLRPNRGGRRSV